MTETKKNSMLNFYFTSSEENTVKKKFLLRRRRLWSKHFEGITYSNTIEFNDKLKELIEKNPALVDEWYEKHNRPKITTPEEKRKRNNEAAKKYQVKKKPVKASLEDRMRALNLDSNVESSPVESSPVESSPVESRPTKKSRLIGDIFKQDLVKKRKTTKQYLSNLQTVKDNANKGLKSLKIEEFDINLFIGNEQLIDATIEKHYEKPQPYYTALCKLFNNYVDQTKTKSQNCLKAYHHYCERYQFHANVVDANKAMNEIKHTKFQDPSVMEQYVPFQKLFSLYQKNKSKLDYYENLLISLYIKSLPMRHDVVRLIYVEKEPKLEDSGNFLYRNEKGDYWLFYKDTKTSSHYKTLNFQLKNESMKRMLDNHIKVKEIKPDSFVFPPHVRRKSSDVFIAGMFKLTGKTKLNQNIYRKIYITHLYDNVYRTPEEINKDAYMLGHTVRTEVNTYYVRTK